MNADHRPRTRRPAGGEFHTALAEAVAARGVTLQWLRSRLEQRGIRVSLATLHYWRSGRSQPERASSLEAVSGLEELLDVPPGTLAGRLGPSRRPGPPLPLAEVDEVVDDHDQSDLVERALAELGLDGATEFADETLHVTVEVDAFGCPSVVTVRGIWRALVEGAHRMPLIYVNDGPFEVVPEISVGGGHLGLDRSSPQEGLIAHEFVLDKPLHVGEQAVLEQRTHWRHEVTDQAYEHYLTRRVTELALWVRFHPERRPRSAHGYTVVDAETSEHELDLEGVTSVHLVVRRFGPGRAGIRWEW